MKTEKFLLQHIRQHKIPVEQMEYDIGINIEQLVQSHRDLKADELVAVCIYLGISPEEIQRQILSR